jgi:hypothetical protein
VCPDTAAWQEEKQMRERFVDQVRKLAPDTDDKEGMHTWQSTGLPDEVPTGRDGGHEEVFGW